MIRKQYDTAIEGGNATTGKANDEPLPVQPEGKEQTAIDQFAIWLDLELHELCINTSDHIRIVNKAYEFKENVERRQIVDAHESGLYRQQSSEEYYDNKFTQ